MKIIKVEKQEPRSPSGGTDAPLQAEVATYRISIQLEDKVYVCQYKADSESDRSTKLKFFLVLLISMMLSGCHHEFVPHDTQSLFIPRFHRSEIVGFFAGLGGTFAALPDLLTIFCRRSDAGMNPRMAAIMSVFQVFWIYYGLLILSRPVIAWNMIAVLINSVSVAAFFHFLNKEKANYAMK